MIFRDQAGHLAAAGRLTRPRPPRTSPGGVSSLELTSAPHPARLLLGAAEMVRRAGATAGVPH